MLQLIDSDNVYITRHAVERFANRILHLDSNALTISELDYIKDIIKSLLPKKIINQKNKVSYLIDGIYILIVDATVITVYTKQKKGGKCLQSKQNR